MDGIMLEGTFIKNFAKACSRSRQHANGILGSPWYNDGRLYATDSQRCYRLTFNRYYGPGFFRLNADACLDAKKGDFLVTPEACVAKGATWPNPEPGKPIDADKLFTVPDPMGPRPHETATTLNARFLGDVAALAASIDKNLAVKVRTRGPEKPALLEFETRWGLCECLVMCMRE